MNKKRVLMLVAGLVSSVGLSFLSLQHTEAGRLLTLELSGNEVVQKEDLLERLSIDFNQSPLALNFKELEAKLKSDALIKNATIELTGVNGLKIQIEEHPLIGCLQGEDNYYYVLKSGEIIDKQPALTCQGIVFKNLNIEEDKEQLSLFVDSLNRLDQTFFALIDEVLYEPLHGDRNRFSIFLSDGNTVKVNSYTMVSKLSSYPLLLSQVNEVYGDVKGVFNLDISDSFNPYRESVDESEADVE